MTTNRPALGRGLSALIPSASQGGAVDTVDIDLIVPNPQQPRTHFEPSKLEELAESIREHGVLQPVLVTRAPGDMGVQTYQLIAGERRLQAARMAGMTRMPVVVKELAGAELLEVALVENLQRQDLNPIEEGLAFRRLADEFHMTQDDIAKRVGRTRAAVANTLRLLALEDDIRSSLVSGQISEGHARALLGIEDSAQRLDAWRAVVADALTVRQAEEIARVLKATSREANPTSRKSRASRAAERSDPHVRALEDELRHAFGAKVSLLRGRAGGRIVISYHSDDELEGILARIRR